MTKFDPTEEQRAIAQATSRPNGPSLMVNAYAGCAKTTTLQYAAREVKVAGLALAFNKKIAQELEGRFAGNWIVKTINGFGHQVWARHLAGAKLQVDSGKLGKLVTQVARARKVDLSSDQWDSIRQLVNKAMMAGIVPADKGEPLIPDLRENWQAIAEDELWLTPEEFEFIYDLAREVLSESIAVARKGIISFDDQVYCPVVLGAKWPQFPILMVDEAQDLSSLNHQMLAKALRADGRLVAVGDSKQAIYAFRGAHSKSMAQIRQLRPQWLDQPLTMTFRCPKVVVSRQQEHAPGFRAHESNRTGRYIHLPAGNGHYEDKGWTWAEFMNLASPGTSRVILCRNNGPLLSMAFKLLRRGIGCYMLGRDLGKNLERLSRDIIPKDETPADACAKLILEWRDKEISLARANGKEERVEGIDDRAQCLLAVLHGAEVRDAGSLRLMLRKMFARESGQVALSSIHKAKGLEWDLVLHLDPWRIPSKWAKQAAQAGHMSQMEQEWNLLYVAETRTRDVICEGNLEDFEQT